MKQLCDVQLELSLKPFRSARTEDIEALTLDIVRKWQTLIRHSDQLSLLLFTGDGTELLEYDGNLNRIFPWAIWIGRGAQRYTVPDEKDPNHESLDGHPRTFVEHPNEYTYADLQRMVQVMKATAEKATGLKVRIGTMLDPGGEFVQTDWKSSRHPEILLEGDPEMGLNIDCTSSFHADSTPYAGFPNGIPEGTPWGTFLGRQTKLFMADMGFEFFWMSNGFGVGRAPYAYGACGEFFDGQTFRCEGNREVRAKVLQFWKLFRQECPDVPVRLRGTDFAVGMDLVNHVIPYQELLDGRLGATQPPNTPWPALTSNFGMALTGYMGRMSVSEGSLPYRHYTSDPWWANSAWVDSFNRSPHDIYLNLALGAVQADGGLKTADRVDFLSVDTSWGEIPEFIPDEVLPHVKAALRYAPDQAGPLVWVYPFDEYNAMIFQGSAQMADVYAGDLFFQEALNNFLPVNTVVSSRTFLAHQRAGRDVYQDRVLISPVPPADSPLEQALLAHANSGGNVMLYGALARAGSALLKALALRNDVPVSGEFELLDLPLVDCQPAGTDTARICHQPVICGGGMTEVDSGAKSSDVLHSVMAAGQGVQRVAARVRRVGADSKGIIAWVRGTSSVDVAARALMDRTMDVFAASRFFRSEKLVRQLLPFLGYEVALDRERPRECARHLAVSRNRNGFRFTLFSEERSMKARLRFPLGAPILEGEPVELRGGAACYRFHRFMNAECRVFVRENDGDFLECNVTQSLSHRFKHRINLRGLKNATVCFFPPDGDMESAKVLLNPDLRLLTIGDKFDARIVTDGFGTYQEIRNVTGILSFAW